MNWIFLGLIVGAVVAAAFGGTMAGVTLAGLDAAKKAIVEIIVPLIGQMALWLGFMQVLREAGVMQSIARGLAPVMRRLFPDVPDDHPAMGAMIMNLAANVLGLGNAATPFGLKAMVELNRLNRTPGVATNSMALFLAINTAGVAVLPLGVVAVRASLGSLNAGGIVIPSILATLCSTIVAIAVAKSIQNRPAFAPERYDVGEGETGETLADGIVGLGEAEQVAETHPRAEPWRTWVLLLFLASIVIAIGLYAAQPGRDGSAFDLTKEILSSWLLPVLMATIVLFGFSHRVKVYEAFVKGAREGFEIAVMIIPFLVAILVSVGMFRASGMMQILTEGASYVTNLIGFPAEALPMALVRPLSGSGAFGLMVETMTSYGPDSFVGFLVSVINGSTETTFYVLAVYFGSVGVRAVRHTMIACLAADLTGVLAALLFSRIFF